MLHTRPRQNINFISRPCIYIHGMYMNFINILSIHTGLNFQNTAHVDAFLYDEADVEELTNDGKIPTHFCRNCGGKNIGEVELLTHSCGRDDLEFIFDALLPELIGGKVLLDVGSRIGAVLFGAYIYSNSSAIIG